MWFSFLLAKRRFLRLSTGSLTVLLFSISLRAKIHRVYLACVFHFKCNTVNHRMGNRRVNLHAITPPAISHTQTHTHAYTHAYIHILRHTNHRRDDWSPNLNFDNASYYLCLCCSLFILLLLIITREKENAFFTVPCEWYLYDAELINQRGKRKEEIKSIKWRSIMSFFYMHCSFKFSLIFYKLIRLD